MGGNDWCAGCRSQPVFTTSHLAKNRYPGRLASAADRRAGVSGPVKKLISKWKSDEAEKEGKGFPASARTLSDAIISVSENLV